MPHPIDAKEPREYYRKRKGFSGMGTIRVPFVYQGETTGCGLPYIADQCKGTPCGQKKEICKKNYAKEKARDRYLTKKKIQLSGC